MPDNKKYDSDTLGQQRRAREDFLELKRIQSGEAKASLPPSADAIMPETIKDKTQNFWFYNKWLVIGIVFIAFIITVCVAQCVSRTDYDLKVVLYTAKFVSTQDTDLILKYLEKHCDDVNGNGEVNINVINCSYNEDGDRQLAQTSNTKIQAILVAEPDCVLFITDDVTTKKLNSISTSVALFDDNSVKLGDEFYGNCQSSEAYTLPENLTMYIRHKTDEQLKQDDDAEKYYLAAEKLIERLK